MQSRYGIDVNNTGADQAFVSAALARAQQARSEAESERAQASAVRTDEVVAGAAVADANRQDWADRSEPAWDSAKRRQQLGESLEGMGDREAVNSRLWQTSTRALTPRPLLRRSRHSPRHPKWLNKSAKAGRWNAVDSNAEGRAWSRLRK